MLVEKFLQNEIKMEKKDNIKSRNYYKYEKRSQLYVGVQTRHLKERDSVLK